ncbi:hypothetical protein G7Y89_g7923 [Cudoniella acicularis]|uniref:Uncharacterized protein n=1 Tax=Cudoniella acicularis TaxID=354080 RepID=A0A8H4W426_9HELO|nr:hypothetical protein G7Y89_g7923 [Cudoniella acicularis]
MYICLANLIRTVCGPNEGDDDEEREMGKPNKDTIDLNPIVDLNGVQPWANLDIQIKSEDIVQGNAFYGLTPNEDYNDDDEVITHTYDVSVSLDSQLQLTEIFATRCAFIKRFEHYQNNPEWALEQLKLAITTTIMDLKLIVPPPVIPEAPFVVPALLSVATLEPVASSSTGTIGLTRESDIGSDDDVGDLFSKKAFSKKSIAKPVVAPLATVHNTPVYKPILPP